MKKVILDGYCYEKVVEGECNNDTYKMPNTYETQIMFPNQLSEAVKELNKDVPEADGKLSSVDMVSRITEIEKTAYHALNSLVALKMFPTSGNFVTRVGQRLSISLNGEGRREIVNLSAGEKMLNRPGNLLDALNLNVVPKQQEVKK